MAPTSNLHHLPNGQTLTILPVFGGFYFKANELNTNHNSAFPAGWTVIMQTEDYSDDHDTESNAVGSEEGQLDRKRHIHTFKQPTLQHDRLFISSISNPSSSEFKASTSPTRQIAMMLWATLNWYFHLPPPSLHVTTKDSRQTPTSARPRGEWRINIKREGVFRGRNLIQKLERMGLISSEDSSTGVNPDEKSADGWTEMFTSRRSFWQLSAKIFLFTLSPMSIPSVSVSPYSSRPSSPVRGDNKNPTQNSGEAHDSSRVGSPGPAPHSYAGPFNSGSHLPTYYPPPPLQYTMTSEVRHPIRPKPPRQGETFYRRYVPSVGQYLSFRTASLSPLPVVYTGPSGSTLTASNAVSSASSLPTQLAVSSISDMLSSSSTEQEDTRILSDSQLLHKWMNEPRVSAFWGCEGPQNKQEEHLRKALTSKNSFPAIGLWDDKPFGYFELYWVKEDILGKYLGGDAGDFDRGIHALVGENEFRGKHRVSCWLSALAHWALINDYRTNAVVLEPRVDNERFLSHLCDAGFLKEREVAFPHKQSAFVKLRRENFESPTL